MYVCMFVCMHVSMNLCIYVSMQICIYVSMYLCIYVSMQICIYVYMYICIYVYMFICIYVYMYICTYVYVYICKFVHIFIFFCSHLFAARVHGPPKSLWLADCFYTGQFPDVPSPPKGEIQSPGKSKPVCGHLPGSRLGVAVPTGVWASRCPRGGNAPSPLLQLVSRVLRREAAKACMLACASS